MTSLSPAHVAPAHVVSAHILERAEGTEIGGIYMQDAGVLFVCRGCGCLELVHSQRIFARRFSHESLAFARCR